jgi:hypothetical protein
MQITLQAVFLSGKQVQIKKGDRVENKVMGQFHQPVSSSNKLISVVLPEGIDLEQYQAYTIHGELTAWAFKDQVSMRVTALRIEEAE